MKRSAASPVSFFGAYAFALAGLGVVAGAGPGAQLGGVGAEPYLVKTSLMRSSSAVMRPIFVEKKAMLKMCHFSRSPIFVGGKVGQKCGFTFLKADFAENKAPCFQRVDPGKSGRKK